jgi:hypothetical protein
VEKRLQPQMSRERRNLNSLALADELVAEKWTVMSTAVE